MEDMFGNDASLKEVRLGHGFSFCGAKQEPLCQLPSSAGTHLLGWRNSSGRVYAASEIPANQAETYRSGIVLGADLICLFSRYYVYDGSPVNLILTTGLTEGVDYTASYANNVEVGTGSVTFEGINDYLGSLTFDFDISQGVPQVSAPEGIVASWGAEALGSSASRWLDLGQSGPGGDVLQRLRRHPGDLHAGGHTQLRERRQGGESAD